MSAEFLSSEGLLGSPWTIRGHLQGIGRRSRRGHSAMPSFTALPTIFKAPSSKGLFQRRGHPSFDFLETTSATGTALRWIVSPAPIWLS
jgi:hypothetical protein